MRFVLLACLAFIATPFALADSHEDLDTVRKYRHGSYEAIGGHMTAIVNSVRNGYRTGELQFHADSIAALSKIVPELFPEGSGGPDTEALPVIWEKPDAFKKRMDTFGTAADNFAAVAGSGNMSEIGSGLQQLGRACKGCHDNFRKEH